MNFTSLSPVLAGMPRIVNHSDDDLPYNGTYKCKFDEEFKYILLPVSYGIVFCVGMILNLIALYVFIFRIRPWNASTTYMFNLAISDTLYVVSLPLLIYYYSKGDNWPFSTALCKIVRFLFYTNLYCSIFFLLCISIHRFLGICYPMKSLQWGQVRYARIACVCVWVTIVAFESPILYFVSTSASDDGLITCHDTSSKDLFDQFVIYSSVGLAMLFCVPFIVIIVCYCLMAKTLMKSTAANSQTSESRKKSIKMIIVVSVVFVVCFLPFHINRTLYYYFRKLDYDCGPLSAINIAYKVTRPLASANSCLDPIVYLLTGPALRRKLPARKTQNLRHNGLPSPSVQNGNVPSVSLAEMSKSMTTKL